ncbi:hypothetical protein PGT21_002720 [Puccinia graminis f. sp. tritici]|uniref:Uncharacterized protein n=1 Tax=Puccinia graminis f. sp. tritici TaxID=56615 RepID=A0A5B0PWG7_PUCGR|nr:hypothetical protein PGT21_002720 [Puccinia graminis f. sp. tritici]KAA1105129.1 hypothetical protein PGTUg99_015383 [Puccinia graminis f. sp. tritici]
MTDANVLLILFAFIAMCTAMDGIWSHTDTFLSRQDGYEGHGSANLQGVDSINGDHTGASTFRKPVKEIDFLPKIGKISDRLAPQAHSQPELERQPEPYVQIASRKRDQQEEPSMSYDSLSESQNPPKTLDLLSSLGRFLTLDNSAIHEETARQAADSRTTSNGVNPFQIGHEKDFLSIRPPSSYHELEKTFENQVRLPVMKKIRMDIPRVGSSSCSQINLPEHRDLSGHRSRIALSKGNVALEPVDTRQPALEHKEIAAETDTNSKDRNSLASNYRKIG